MKLKLFIILAFLPLTLFLQGQTVAGIYTQDPVELSIENGGAIGVDDWLNPTSGLAEFWWKVAVTGTTSIVTGNGFTGNAQRVDNSAASLFRIQNFNVFNYPVTGKLIVKHRNDTPVQVVCQRYNSGGGSLGTATLGTLSTNTGTATTTEIQYSVVGDHIGVVGFGISVVGYFEIDEIELTESIEYETIGWTYQGNTVTFDATPIITPTVSCDSIVPCDAIIPCDAIYTSFIDEIFEINEIQYYKHEENLMA